MAQPAQKKVRTELGFDFPSCVSRSAYEEARRVCRSQIKTKGICEIPGFLHADAVTKILGEAERLKKQEGYGFRSHEEHNVYLEEASGFEAEEVGSIRSKVWSSSKVLINQRELAPTLPELVEIFQWPGLREIIREAFDLEHLHPSSDPVGGVYLNFFEKGDQLGWHFDRSEYSVNLILRECTVEDHLEDKEKPHGTSQPGAFMYFPDSRDFFDENKKFDLDRLDQWETKKTSESEQLNLVVPKLKPGTLYLFAGNRSLHCVSENTTDVNRVNAIFTFNTKPNVALNEYTRKKFFGC